MATAPGYQHKESFYQYTTGLVFENLKPRLLDAKVVIDRCGDRDFRQSLAKYLKRKINEGHGGVILDVKMEPCHSNNLLQLADMICGAVARSMHPEKSNWEFRGIVSHREWKAGMLARAGQ
jgi:hypothetical protein